MSANEVAFWLLVALFVAQQMFLIRWIERGRRYEQTLRLARGLIDMNRADYALHHIREALERR